MWRDPIVEEIHRYRREYAARFNYDLDRVSACCHHLLDTKGNPVSFCEYNARVRQRDPWDAFPPLKDAESARV